MLHLNTTDPELIAITRGVIPLNSVRLEMLEGGIGYLRLSSFSGTTNGELEDAIERFDSSNGTGLVLDLRNNPGGLVSAVVAVASQFLDDGLVLYQIDARGRRTDWEVKSGGIAHDVPLVVLVNEFSASASEVLSGALRDHDRAEIVGTTTFGKGSVSRLKALSDGGGLYYSYGRWYTPNDRLIEGNGIVPDIVVPQGLGAQGDLQLEKALESLSDVVSSMTT